ncbi:MAG: hypothetical protein WA485_11420 [Candidatus Sulfotelmatobacter sp.]
MSTTPHITEEQRLLQRQAGIQSWEEFSGRAFQDAEPAPEKPTKELVSLSSLTRDQRADWKTSGDLPTSKLTAELERELKPGEQLSQEEREAFREAGKWPLKTNSKPEARPEPKSEQDLTSEEREHWRRTSEWPLKEKQSAPDFRASDETQRSAVADTTPRTPEEARVQHEKNFADFSKSAQADPELKAALDGVKLDRERGGVVVHALADLPADQRRDVAMELAKRPEVAGALAKATSQQVRDGVLALAQAGYARRQYPDADQKIFPTIQTILADQKIPHAVKVMLNESPVLIDLVYSLGSDPGELAKFIQIAKTNPNAALRHLATTEAALRGQSTAAKERMESQLTEARARYGDADKKIFPALRSITDDQRISPAVKQLINDSDVLVDLVYVLGSDAQELSKFVQLAKTNPGAAIRKLVTTEALVRDQLAANSGKSSGRGNDGRFQKQASAEAEPMTRAPRPPVEVGGRTSHPENSSSSAVKSGDYRAAKAAFNREYLKSH